MLQFILGRASSGKTYTITQKIAESISKGESPVLLVPEQFSFESERNILKAVGDGDAQRVSVVSFTRLCDEVERVAGGVCGQGISDADKIILMTRAIRICNKQLTRFKRYVGSASFARLMIDSINEFKLEFITAADLYDAANNTEDEQLKLKLYDTALIYENYDAVLAEKFIDNADRLTKLYYALDTYKYFENKTVFIDSFKGFSGQQYKLLEKIISQAKNVTVTLCDHPSDTRTIGLFANVKRVKNRISSIARRFAIGIGEDIILTGKNYGSDDLSALEEFMATGKCDYNGRCDNITVCCADSIYSEADFVARNIRRIVRETGARYSDFVVIARSTQPYEDALETACKKNNVSCFIDKRIPLIEMPTAVSLVAAANCAKNFCTENILRFHKSGIGILTEDEIATLENYAYLWNIDGLMWKNNWTMDPSGFSANETLTPEKEMQLAAINALRKKATTPLLQLKQDFTDTAQKMSRALVQLFDSCDAAERFKALSKEYKNDDDIYRDAIKQSWDSIMKILNSLVLCFGETEVSKLEFCEALRLSLSLETVGVIPQMIDEVIFGAADRIRPSRPKYAFIVGANQGVFPKTEQSSGLFVGAERKKIIDLGLELTDNTLDLAVDEESLLYSNLCCASNGVFISYATSLDGVSSAEASAFVADIKSNFNCNTVGEPSPLSQNYMPESYEDAFSQLCVNLSDGGSDMQTLATVLNGSCIADRVNGVLQGCNKVVHSITSDTARQLFGTKIKMSSTKFDTLSRCRFMYFCKYGLRVERLQPVEFSALQRGTLVHYVLQRAVEVYGKDLSAIDKDAISDLVEKYTQEYLDMVVGYSDIETPYFKYLVSTIKRTLKYVVERLALEFAQSEFTPIKCELQIGNGGDMPEIEIPIDNYGSLALTGKIDRIDSWNGFVRVIDYKTGQRNFKLPDILFGQNMQMLIYLYAVTNSQQFGGQPAGVLYMPASRDRDGEKADRRMSGLLAADQSLIYAMEKENNGEFVPKFSEKSPSNSFVTSEDFEKIFEFIKNKLESSGASIFGGDIAADPIDGIDSPACKYCEYQSICQMAYEKHKKVPKMANQEVLEEIERQVSGDGI